jgi:hypothetical protein
MAVDNPTAAGETAASERSGPGHAGCSFPAAEVVMRRSWVIVFALALYAAPALAQDLPPLPLPPVVVPVPMPFPVPSPGMLPLPVPWPAVQPSPGPSPSPPPPPELQAPPGVWQYSEVPRREPPPPPPKLHGLLLAADLSAALPIRSPDTKTVGFGGDFRIGYRFALGPMWLAPQATAGIVGFPQYDLGFRAGLGGQLGVAAGLVEPSVYAFGGGFANVWKSGPGVRTGAAVDFRVGRFFMPGVHVDYNAASWDTGSVRYVGAGAHVGFLVGR